MDLGDIRNVNMEIYRKARMAKMLAASGVKWIGVVDGKEITAFDYKKCTHCKRRKLRDRQGGLKYQYYHEFTAFILACSGFHLL